MSELPKGWAETTIGEVIEPYMTIDPRQEPDSQFRYIDIGSIDNATQIITEPKAFAGRDAPSRARRVVHSGDVLFSTVRTYLKNIAVVPPSLDGVLTSTGIAVLRPSSAIESGYLFSWVRSEIFVENMSKAQDGTLYPAVRDSDVSAGSIPLPPLAEQRRIVAKLDALIAATGRARAELDRIPALTARYKQTILSAAFDGELTRKWRAKHGVDADAPVVRLEEVAKDLSYGSSAKSSKEGEVPVLRMGNIQSGTLDWHDLVYTSDPAEIKKYLLTSGDVLFNRTNSPELVGKTAVFRGERKAIFAGYLIRVRCEDNMLPEYLGFCLNSPQGRDYCWRVKTDGVSQSNINAKKLAAFSFRLPSITEQSEIVRRVQIALDWLDRVAAERDQAVRLLPRLDQAIRAKAFRGELVPQISDDEPAFILLERVRSARAEAPKRGRKLKLGATGAIEFTGTGSLTVAQKEQEMKTRTDVPPNYLSDIVKKSGGQIKADALWRASEMSIDEFYKQLRNEINMGFVREGASKELLEFADAA